MRIGSTLLCLVFFVINYVQSHAQSDTGAIKKRQHIQSKPLPTRAIPKEKFFTIYGKFINYNPSIDVSGFCKVFYQDIYNNHSASLRIAIDSAGNFRFRFPLLHSQEISIEHRNSTQWVFAKAGDSLYVQLELD
jgi:hypothetical protein